jgi:hypothetical protein
MPRLRQLIVGFSALAALGFLIHASLAHGNDRGEVKATIGGARVTIDYGQPSLKGRDPLQMIQPGKVWRLGSEAPTTIESDKDLDFGGTKVPKGKHILLARYVESGKWTLVVSSQPANRFEPSAKIAEIPLTLQEMSVSVETLTLKLADKGGKGVIDIAWGKLRLAGSFTIAQ